MSELFFFIAGLAIGFMWTDMTARQRYQRMLEMCSRVGTPEKFKSGTFYYIVPEPEYNELKETK